ncbi:MAG: HAD-IG family 5'-nucleotidase [Calothrix sp. SM1_5_4]|nr:HAD-IG family 5'-nucleotidase [Calothrix sp. SM1_5_4]
MKRIRYLGFDMDHTLVRYKSENFEALAHRIMIEKLVNDEGYPKSILNLDFPTTGRSVALSSTRTKATFLSSAVTRPSGSRTTAQVPSTTASNCAATTVSISICATATTSRSTPHFQSPSPDSSCNWLN